MIFRQELRRDWTIIGCVMCRQHGGPLSYSIPPPYASLDARDDVRMHPDCYRKFVWAVWAILGLTPIPETWFP